MSRKMKIILLVSLIGIQYSVLINCQVIGDALGNTVGAVGSVVGNVVSMPGAVLGPVVTGSVIETRPVVKYRFAKRASHCLKSCCRPQICCPPQPVIIRTRSRVCPRSPRIRVCRPKPMCAPKIRCCRPRKCCIPERPACQPLECVGLKQVCTDCSSGQCRIGSTSKDLVQNR